MASQVVVELTCPKKAAKTTATLTIPLMQDSAESAAISGLSLLLLYSFASGQNYINPSAAIILRIHRFSCDYGLSVHTPSVIIGLENDMVKVGAFVGARDYA